MVKYRVPMTGWANITVDVEVPDDATPEEIVEAARDAASPSLCHQCAGSGNDYLEIGDEWEEIRPNGPEGLPEFYRVEGED